MNSVAFRYVIAVFALMLLLLAGCSSGRYVARAVKPVHIKKVFSDFTLDNGLRVLVREREGDGPVAVQLWVGGGSLADPEGKEGLSHFVEHMLFDTAKSLRPGADGTPGDSVEAMGGQIDGHTGRDYSYVEITLPDGGWEQAVRILYGMASADVFSEDAVEAEKKTVADELKNRDLAPGLAALEGLFDTAYQKHPYRLPVAGTPESVMTFTAADAVKLHKDIYVPANMTLVVCGGVNPLRVRTVATKTFGSLPSAKAVFPEVEPEPYQIAVRDRHINRDTRLSYMVMGWHVCGASDEDIYALDALRAILGLGRGSILSKNIKERRRLAVDVGTELFATRDPGMLAITATMKPEDVDYATEEILKELKEIKRRPVEEDRLQEAVKAMDAVYKLETGDADGQAFALGYWATVYRGDRQPDYMETISQVTPQEVQRVAQKYIGEGNYTRVVVGPAQEVKE